MILVMLRGFINALIDIAYPKTCVVCKKSLKNTGSVDNVICRECWGKIKKNTPPFCHCCGRHLEKNRFIKHICPCCVKKRLHFDRAFSPCAYEGVIKELTHQFKYGYKDYLGVTLSKLMVDFIKEYTLPMDWLDFVVPVPLHKTRYREREFNQAQVLSNYIASAFNKKVLTGCLLRHRSTKAQVELKDEQRFLNVKDSFSVSQKEAIENKNILLVDDVLTTGATSSEAASALKGAGAKIVFVLTLAN